MFATDRVLSGACPIKEQGNIKPQSASKCQAAICSKGSQEEELGQRSQGEWYIVTYASPFPIDQCLRTEQIFFSPFLSHKSETLGAGVRKVHFDIQGSSETLSFCEYHIDDIVSS